MERESRKAFIVEAVVGKQLDHRLMHSGKFEVLTFVESSGGWFQWDSHTQTIQTAHVFSDKESALQAAKDCPGPWYSMPDPKSIKVVSVTYYPSQKALIVKEVKEENEG